ncbi:uncharacterized protein encoded by LINC01588-like isoform X1 [Pan troglodytes]|uniref:uncharacterized protein encoded by LINC01588-like isoform X1 n=1 Tax=Pan troglodytes TaxID=9598 RepID=UPI003013DC60
MPFPASLAGGVSVFQPMKDHFTHPFFASRVDGTVERGNPALWLCLSSPTGTRATKATEDPTLSSMQASQLEEARRQRPRGHQEAFEPAERAWQHNAERHSGDFCVLPSVKCRSEQSKGPYVFTELKHLECVKIPGRRPELQETAAKMISQRNHCGRAPGALKLM